MNDERSMQEDIETRVASLESVVGRLVDSNTAIEKNFERLHQAFETDLPDAFKQQDAATRAGLAQIDKAIELLQEHAKGLRALIDACIARTERVEALLGSRKAGTIN